MLIVEVAAGVFLGMLAFHYRKQLLPVFGWLLFLAILSAGGFAYYLFTTPEKRHEHFEGAVGIATLLAVILLGAWFSQTPAYGRLNAWFLRVSERWERVPRSRRVWIGIAGFVLFFGLVTLWAYYGGPQPYDGYFHDPHGR